MKRLIFSSATLVFLAFTGLAQDYSIDSFTIESGGGTITGGDYSLSATVGQPGAGGTLSGGDFTMVGGFWGIPPTGSSSLFENNLASNGDAESGAGSLSGNDVLPVPNWTTYSNFTVALYGTASGVPSPGPAFGTNFFSGGPDNSFSSAIQTIDLSAGAVEIDSGTVRAELSGWFGGVGTQDNRASLIATFLSASTNALATVTIGDVLAADRTNVSSLLFRAATNVVPAGTRSIQLMLAMTRVEGTFNDGSADNLSLVLRLPPSLLRITDVERIGDDLRLSFTSVAGQNYAIQSSADLSFGTWTTLPGAPTPGVGGTVALTLTNALNQPQQFYRVKIVP